MAGSNLGSALGAIVLARAFGCTGELAERVEAGRLTAGRAVWRCIHPEGTKARPVRITNPQCIYSMNRAFSAQNGL